MVARFRLTLYVTPDCSGRALLHLYRALEILPYTDYELTIVNLKEEPDKARELSVLSTPALVYHAPGGDILTSNLSEVSALRKILGIEGI